MWLANTEFMITSVVAQLTSFPQPQIHRLKQQNGSQQAFGGFSFTQSGFDIMGFMGWASL